MTPLSATTLFLKQRGAAILLLWMLATGCVRETTLDIDLPAAEPYLVVESYLVEGQPYKVGLMRSVDFFAQADNGGDGIELPAVTDAEVRIFHAGDTLRLQYVPPGLPDNTFLFGEYRNLRAVPANYTEPFELEIRWRGNLYTSTCRMLPPITQLDTTNFFRDNGDVNIRIAWEEPDPTRMNYYRSVLDFGNPTGADRDRDGEQDEPENFADESDDQIFQDLGTETRRFTYTGFLEDDAGDTLVFTQLHVEQAYNDYINSTEANNLEDANPFSEPANIISNIEGERVLGIFSAYHPYTETYIIPAPGGP